MVYSNGNFVYTIGDIPVGSGSAAPPTPPPPTGNYRLTIGGISGSLTSYATFKSGGTTYQYVASSDAVSASGYFPLPYGTMVSISFWSKPYTVVGDVGVTGLSATGSSERLPVYEGDNFGNYINITGYITSTASAMPESTVKPKTFYISAAGGTTSFLLTGSGAGEHEYGGSFNSSYMPFRFANNQGGVSGGYFPSSCIVTRRTGDMGATAEVFEPIECSAVSFSAIVKHGAENAGWSNPHMYTNYNFRRWDIPVTPFGSTGTATASGRITANLTDSFISSLASRTESSTALGFSIRYESEGSKTTGFFSALSWTATGIAK